MPPPPLQLGGAAQQPSERNSARSSARDSARDSVRDGGRDSGRGKVASPEEAGGRRSPPPPYDWEQPAPPPSQPPPRHTNNTAAPAPVGQYNAGASNRNRASAPRPQEHSPSTIESEPESDGRYTDNDSYDHPYDSAVGEEDVAGDEIVDMAIRVVVRKRPISKRELANGDRDVMEVGRRGRVMVHEPKTKVDLTKIIETQEFRFDDAFQAEETNELIYSRTIKNLVSFVFDGGKASCFAYGQTGSGRCATIEIVCASCDLGTSF